MHSQPGHPLPRQLVVENPEIISKAMIRGVSHLSAEEEGAAAYPLSRTDRGVSGDRRPFGAQAFDCFPRRADVGLRSQF